MVVHVDLSAVPVTDEQFYRLCLEQNKIAPPCPGFVVELRSPSDRLEALQAKTQE